MWLGGLVVRALDSQRDSLELDSQLLLSVLGRVTVFGWAAANHLSISPSHPGQLSLLPSVGREMNTNQSALMLCSWGEKAGMAHSTCG